MKKIRLNFSAEAQAFLRWQSTALVGESQDLCNDVWNCMWSRSIFPAARSQGLGFLWQHGTFVLHRQQTFSPCAQYRCPWWEVGAGMVEGGGCRSGSGAQVLLWKLCCGFGLMRWFGPGARKANLVLCPCHQGMLGLGLWAGVVEVVALCLLVPDATSRAVALSPILLCSPLAKPAQSLSAPWSCPRAAGKAVPAGFWPQVWEAPGWVSSLGSHGAKKQCERSDWIMTVLLAKRIFTFCLIRFNPFWWSGFWWEVLVLCLFSLSPSRWTGSP